MLGSRPGIKRRAPARMPKGALLRVSLAETPSGCAAPTCTAPIMCDTARVGGSAPEWPHALPCGNAVRPAAIGSATGLMPRHDAPTFAPTRRASAERLLQALDSSESVHEARRALERDNFARSSHGPRAALLRTWTRIHESAAEVVNLQKEPFPLSVESLETVVSLLKAGGVPKRAQLRRQGEGGTSATWCGLGSIPRRSCSPIHQSGPQGHRPGSAERPARSSGARGNAVRGDRNHRERPSGAYRAGGRGLLLFDARDRDFAGSGSSRHGKRLRPINYSGMEPSGQQDEPEGRLVHQGVGMYLQEGTKKGASDALRSPRPRTSERAVRSQFPSASEEELPLFPTSEGGFT